MKTYIKVVNALNKVFENLVVAVLIAGAGGVFADRDPVAAHLGGLFRRRWPATP